MKIPPECGGGRDRPEASRFAYELLKESRYSLVTIEIRVRPMIQSHRIEPLSDRRVRPSGPAEPTMLLRLARAGLDARHAWLVVPCEAGSLIASADDAGPPPAGLLEAACTIYCDAHEGFGVEGGFAYAGVPVSGEAAVLLVAGPADRGFGPDHVTVLAGIARLIGAALAEDAPEVRLARAQAVLAAQSATIRRQIRDLAHSRKIFDSASSVARIGVWQCTLPDQELTWTDGVYDIFELPRGVPVPREAVLPFYDPESLAELDRVRSRAIAERGSFTLDARIVTAKGRRRWMRITANVECENGEPVRIFGMKQDITEEKALWEQTRQLAERDVMTGLANRIVFQAALTDTCRTAGDRSVALLLIDLDGFKHVNDTFGHGVGDECLKQIARRLNEICGSARLVARLGGDEFAVLMNPGCTGEDVDRLAAAILDAVRQPIVWQDQSFQLGASIGVDLAEISIGRDPAELLTRADIALYAAKMGGRNTMMRFVPRMKAEVDSRYEIVRSIAGALDQGELALFYQPKVCLKTRRLLGFEALLRWQKDGEIISAGAFAPAFDDPELARRLGHWVMGRALDQAKAWHEAGFAFGHIAVNLTATQLREHMFARALSAQIAARGLEPHMVQVEVTEDIVIGDGIGSVKRTLGQLRDLGIRSALDDFGTGYASLVHLRSCPVDAIKIDRSFVMRFLTSPQDRAILESVVRLGLDLGMQVIAEGIEDEAQLAYLAGLGCPMGQGFLFARAMPAGEAKAWVDTQAA